MGKIGNEYVIREGRNKNIENRFLILSKNNRYPNGRVIMKGLYKEDAEGFIFADKICLLDLQKVSENMKALNKRKVQRV